MSTSRQTELQGTHVLVVDDDQISRQLLRSALEFAGATVTATNAIDALRVTLIADVIVCDLTSAELAGPQFLDHLQKLHVRAGRQATIMAVVPAGTRSARVRAAGFESYLMRPVGANGLRAAVWMAR